MRQLRMGLEVLSDLSAFSDGLYWYCWLYCIVLAVLNCWIVSYHLDWIVSYRIWLDQETLDFLHLAGYCLDGMDGLDGVLVGRG